MGVCHLPSQNSCRALQEGIEAYNLVESTTTGAVATGLLCNSTDGEFQVSQLRQLLLFRRKFWSGLALLDGQVDIVHCGREIDVVLLEGSFG